MVERRHPGHAPRLIDALLVIDMQVAILEPAHRALDVLECVSDLITRARRTGVPVVYLQHDHATWAPLKAGTPTWAIHPKLAPAAGEPVIAKTASDSFYETGLLDELRGRGATRLVVTGMQTEYCVDTTCRRAISLGFDVTLVADGHTTWDGSTPAAEIIRYHNAMLPNVAHPRHRITVRPAREIVFESR